MGYFFVEQPFTSDDDVWVLRGGNLRTRSGWEHSSLKKNLPGDVRVPGGVNYGGNVLNLGPPRCARFCMNMEFCGKFAFADFFSFTESVDCGKLYNGEV